MDQFKQKISSIPIFFKNVKFDCTLIKPLKLNFICDLLSYKNISLIDQFFKQIYCRNFDAINLKFWILCFYLNILLFFGGIDIRKTRNIGAFQWHFVVFCVAKGSIIFLYGVWHINGTAVARTKKEHKKWPVVWKREFIATKVT